MQCTYYIFLRLIFTITILLRIVINAQVSTRTYQNGGLYDLFQERLKNLEGDYQTNPLAVGGIKRSLETNYVGLYDEFKKRLDNFNAALVVDENGQPQEDKRSVGSQSLYDRFKNRLHTNDNKGKKVSLEEELKDDIERSLNLIKSDKEQIEKKSAENKKLIITEPQPIKKSKYSISSLSQHEAEPGKLQDQNKNYRDRINDDDRIHRSLDDQNPTYDNDKSEQDENNNMGQFNIKHEIKNQDYEKRNIHQGDDDILEPQELNDNPELEDDTQSIRFKNFAIEDQLPFGTNKWSLYPRIFTKHTLIHLPPYLHTNGSKLLQNYARKINTTAFELAKKIVRLKNTNFLKKVINEGKAQKWDKYT